MALRIRYRRKLLLQLVFLFVLVLGAIGAFALFHRENDKNTLQQNREYTSEVCLQMAAQLGNQLNFRKNDLEILSYVVADTDASRLTDADYLKYLQDISKFDYIEFIDSNGTNHNAEGASSDSSDRKNYIEGINGGSGINVVFDSRITHETLLIFYVPVRNAGQIVGVLNGMVREASLKSLMQVTMNDEPATNFLCMSDGTIITCTHFERPVTNYLDGLVSGDITDDETTALVRRAFEEKKPIKFFGKTTNGRGAVAAVPVLDDWMFVQTFPAAVNEKMIRSSNAVGLRFELILILLFATYVAYLLFQWFVSSRNLKHEKVLNSALREKNKDAELINAVLAEDYTNVYLINTAENSVEPIKQNGYVVEQMQAGNSGKAPFDEVWNRYINQCVHPDDCEALLENTSIKKLTEELKKKQNYRINFRSINDGLHYFQLNYTLIEEGIIVAGFRNIDEIVWQEEAKKELNKANDILHALTEDVTNVYVINTDNGTLEIIKQETVNAAQARDGEVISAIEYDSLWLQYCKNYLIPEDFERVYRTGVLKNVIEELKTKEEVSCNYNSYGTGLGVPYQLKYVMLTEKKILMSAHNVSKIVEREKQFALLQEAYEKLDDEKKLLVELSDVFYSIHYVNIVDNSHRMLQVKRPNVEAFLGEVDGMDNQEIIWLVMKYVCSKDFVEDAIKFTDFSTLSDRMRNKKNITLEVIDDKNEWVRFMFVRMGNELTADLTEIFFISQLIEEEVREKEKLRKASYMDELTGVLNRNAFTEEIIKINAEPIPEKLKLMLLDVNGLKMTNDTIGHIAGDELIAGTAECIQKAIGNEGVVYRTGGDEFVVLTEIDEESFDNVLQRLDEYMENWRGEHVSRLYFSRGYVFAAEIPEGKLSDLMNEADLRMYRAKQEFYRIHKEYDGRRAN